ncbi:hypothetical protein Ddc_10371 [Ditylenchus destructor]|nr:hypothetical protein Ddc_10371 [Ditylenchus destructor]
MIPAIVFVIVFCILDSSSLEVKKILMQGFALHAKNNKPAADVILKFQYSAQTFHPFYDFLEVTGNKFSAKTEDGEKTFFNSKTGLFTFKAYVGSGFNELPASVTGVRVVPDPENADVVFKDVVVYFNF